MTTAIVFLTITPHENTIEFAKEIKANTQFDTYIICDKETKKDEDWIIHITDEKCLESGYKDCNISTNVVGKNPTSWDKYCYLFCEVYKQYDFVWVFEDDVFIPSVETIINLNNKYQTFDLNSQ